MARLQVFTDTLAIGASNTTGVNLGDGEFNRFSIVFPTTNPLTAAADITAQSAQNLAPTTWYQVSYSNNPSTATSALTPWGASRSSFANNVMCEAALFAQNFRLKFGTAATAAGTFYYICGKD